MLLHFDNSAASTLLVYRGPLFPNPDPITAREEWWSLTGTHQVSLWFRSAHNREHAAPCLLPRSVIGDGYGSCAKVLAPACGIAARGYAIRAVLTFAIVVPANRAVLIREVQRKEGWPCARVAIALSAAEVHRHDGGCRELFTGGGIGEGSGLVDRDPVDGTGILVNAARERDGPGVRGVVGHHRDRAYVLVLELKGDGGTVDLCRIVDPAHDWTRQGIVRLSVGFSVRYSQGERECEGKNADPFNVSPLLEMLPNFRAGLDHRRNSLRGETLRRMPRAGCVNTTVSALRSQCYKECMGCSKAGWTTLRNPLLWAIPSEWWPARQLLLG